MQTIQTSPLCEIPEVSVVSASLTDRLCTSTACIGSWENRRLQNTKQNDHVTGITRTRNYLDAFVQVVESDTGQTTDSTFRLLKAEN